MVGMVFHKSVAHEMGYRTNNFYITSSLYTSRPLNCGCHYFWALLQYSVENSLASCKVSLGDRGPSLGYHGVLDFVPIV